MHRKSFFTLIFTAFIVGAGSIAAFSQTSPVNGKVELVNADGTKTPVAGAVIEIYRTDIKGSLPSAKTNKRGEFAVVGFMPGGEYTFSFSAPGAAPTLQYKVKGGMENLVITMSPGTGRKYTEAEVRQGAASVAKGVEPAEMTAAEKKERADLEAKNKEILAKNEKIAKSTEVINRAIKEGNDAYSAKNYDLAIAKYQEGIDSDPEFIGSAPIFYNNRGAASTARAVDNFNKTVKITDPTEKVAGLASVRKDLVDAIDGLMKSWNMLKAAVAEPNDKNNIEKNKVAALTGARDTFLKSTQTEQIDPTLIEAAKILLPEYQAIETDAAKKAGANLIMADMYRVTGDSENAILAYQKILTDAPDNLDALSGAGFSLVNIGYINNDKTKLQEGANLLQKFASAAPDTNKFKQDAIGLIETLKKEQNVTPQKTPKRKN